MNKEAVAYFDSFTKYIKRGIDKFLKLRVKRAGFLLMMVMSGIDTLGGICYGFKRNNSRKRSTDFMTQIMGISESLAEYLYSVVRCGLFHEGSPKLGLQYFVLYDRLDAGKTFYRDFKSGNISMNVVEFAYSYLEAIKKISDDPGKYIKYSPKLDDNERDCFDKAKKCIEGDIKCLQRKVEQKGSRWRTITSETVRDKWIEEELADDHITTTTNTIPRRFRD